jgi:hypothetical protein
MSTGETMEHQQKKTPGFCTIEPMASLTLSMKKTRSVDFSSLLRKHRSTENAKGENLVASQFSLRAARGSYCNE